MINVGEAGPTCDVIRTQPRQKDSPNSLYHYLFAFSVFFEHGFRCESNVQSQYMALPLYAFVKNGLIESVNYLRITSVVYALLLLYVYCGSTAQRRGWYDFCI